MIGITSVTSKDSHGVRSGKQSCRPKRGAEILSSRIVSESLSHQPEPEMLLVFLLVIFCCCDKTQWPTQLTEGRVVWGYGFIGSVHNDGWPMAANGHIRRLSDHIFNSNHEVERGRKLQVGEAVNSQTPAPVMSLLQQSYILPTQTVPPNEDQVFQYLSFLI